MTSDLTDEPATKKRKLPNGSLPIHAVSDDRTIILEAPEISFTIPQRKKLVCGIYHYPQTGTYTLAAKNHNGEVEFEVPVNTIGTAMKIPVPEKAQKQWNYVFLPRTGEDGAGMGGGEGVLFTVNEATKAKKQEYITGNDTHMALLDHLSDKNASLLDAALDLAGVKITVPSETEFASATPEAHRKNEKAYHVKAFRGSKDGFLFFLSTGIFFGFKKPLFYVGLEDIQSVSYTSVLQRTFNMVITYREEGEAEDMEIEFSMLDQADYAGINGYVQRHGLSDASLAEGRRAKMLGKKKAEANGVKGEDGEEDDGRTELEKAEAQLQDEEDEGEEDFELGSDDGDSGGSDVSDEDYDEEGENIVEAELGSEAEDVSGEEEDEEEEDEEDEVVQEAPQRVPVRAPVAPLRRAAEPASDDNDQL